MQKLNRIPWMIGAAGTLLVVAFYFLNMISLLSLVKNALVFTSLLAAGIALILLDKSTGILKVTGTMAAWLGFILLALALYKFIELKQCWHLGTFLLAFGLLSGIYARLQVTTTWLKWTTVISGTLSFAVLAGLLFKLENPFFYTAGSILLAVFSIVSILSTLIRKSPQNG